MDTSDLGPVPELLRTILEETLSQEASPASLDRFLPRIRDIIINLLHGLKRKQQRLRAKQAKDGQGNGASLQQSNSVGSLSSGLNQMLEDTTARKSAGRSSERRTGSGNTLTGDFINGELSEDAELASRYVSSSNARESLSGAPSDLSSRQANRESQKPLQTSYADTSLMNNTSQPSSTIAPRADDGSFYGQGSGKPMSQKETTQFFQPPPPPPPKQQDALAALQRGGDLERRASRRYSAYQISKHLGASTNGIPMLPPSQNSPIPNRGRDVRDSMNAVRTRGSGIYSRAKSAPRAGEPSPVTNSTLSHRISEESTQSGGSRHQSATPASDGGDHALEAGKSADLSPRPQLGATLTSPLESLPTYNAPACDGISPSNSKQLALVHEKPMEGDQTIQEFIPEQSPQPGKDLTLFLQYKTRIKKFVLSGGSSDLSVPRLQLAFIEKFAWNTHSNGNDLPEIYIQDPVSGVRHELEDLRDVKDRSVLVLNVEALDEVKKHIDEGLGGIRKLVEGVRSTLDGQQLSLQRVSDRQQDTSKDLARLSMKASPTAAVPPTPTSKSKPRLFGDQAVNVKSLRQELAVVRQTFTSLVTDMNSSMTNVRDKASSIKTIAISGVMPELDTNTGRSYVNSGKKSLGDDSERIVNKVDDLQDTVEELRKDVVTRGVRPLPRQLETVNKSISQASAEVKKMQEFLRREKPTWTKIWEKELEVVCTDRDFLTMQEELATDLQDDLEKATQTFALVEQATKQQNTQYSQGPGGVNLRSTSKGLAAIANAADQDIDPQKAKDGVLGEVRALRPNHENRIEAIERAEKARQRELETRREGEFAKEVSAFVEEGRLKKSGGVEEMERLRRARDERNMREAWQKQKERAIAKEGEIQNAGDYTNDSEAREDPLNPQQNQVQLDEQDGGRPTQGIRPGGVDENDDQLNGEVRNTGKGSSISAV